MTRRIRAAGGLVAGPVVSAAVHATYVQDVAAAWPALLIAAAGCVCLGLPALALVRRRGPARLGHVVLAGVCAALVAAVVLFLYITVSHGEVVSRPFVRHFLVLFAAHGAIVALVYWAVALRGDPG